MPSLEEKLKEEQEEIDAQNGRAYHLGLFKTETGERVAAVRRFSKSGPVWGLLAETSATRDSNIVAWVKALREEPLDPREHADWASMSAGVRESYIAEYVSAREYFEAAVAAQEALGYFEREELVPSYPRITNRWGKAAHASYLSDQFVEIVRSDFGCPPDSVVVDRPARRSPRAKEATCD